MRSKGLTAPGHGPGTCRTWEDGSRERASQCTGLHCSAGLLLSTVEIKGMDGPPPPPPPPTSLHNLHPTLFRPLLPWHVTTMEPALARAGARPAPYKLPLHWLALQKPIAILLARTGRLVPRPPRHPFRPTEMRAAADPRVLLAIRSGLELASGCIITALAFAADCRRLQLGERVGWLLSLVSLLGKHLNFLDNGSEHDGDWRWDRR